jgi:S1-C subfamily serine protease
MASGTGFFISETGEIITNRHVVLPGETETTDDLIEFKRILVEVFNEKVIAYSDTMIFLRNYFNENYDTLSQESIDYLKSEYARFDDLYEESIEVKAKIDHIDISEISPKIQNVVLGIAYHDTYVTEYDDLHECVLIRSSEDPTVDLAMIQTKDKLIRKRPELIFNFSDNNPNVQSNPEKHKERDIRSPVHVNDAVFMIGYNRGFALANTKNGIQCQFTKGEVSQASDGQRILYTIPTLEGSSGSPVVDKWGNLVGVNFSKLKDSQNFNFAIPVNELKKFYEKE